MAIAQDRGFKGRHFASEVILWALRWYLAFDQLPRSRRDAAGPRRRGRSHDAVSLDPGSRRQTGAASPATSPFLHRFLAGGRNVDTAGEIRRRVSIGLEVSHELAS